MRGRNIIADLRAKTVQTSPPSQAFPQPEPASGRSDDYIVEREVEEGRPSVANQGLRIVQNLLLVVLAAISLALFCLVALLLGVF